MIKSLSKLFLSFRVASQKGFTLIELLVVIGILGVLAAALVATIDPFEQLKKAEDANVKNTSVEFINANIRYFTTHNQLPWGKGGCLGGSVPTALVMWPSMSDCLSLLIDDGEIKGAFTTVTGVLESITVTGDSLGQNVTACFLPQSRAQRSDENTKWNVDGSPVSGTTNCGPTATACYWCSE